MTVRGTISLWLAFALFLVFFADVAFGAAGAMGFLSDVGEMLTLLGAATLFVIGVLAREASAKNEITKGGPAI